MYQCLFYIKTVVYYNDAINNNNRTGKHFIHISYSPRTLLKKLTKTEVISHARQKPQQDLVREIGKSNSSSNTHSHPHTHHKQHPRQKYLPKQNICR